jgi:hypothetical protein
MRRVSAFVVDLRARVPTILEPMTSFSECVEQAREANRRLEQLKEGL